MSALWAFHVFYHSNGLTCQRRFLLSFLNVILPLKESLFSGKSGPSKKEWPSKNLTSTTSEVQLHHVSFLCKKLRVTKKKATHTSVPSVPLVPGGLKVTKVKTQRELESTILRRTGKDHWNQWGSTNNFPQKANLDTKKKHGGCEVKKGQGETFQVCFAGLWCHDVVKDPKKRAEGICYVQWSKNEGTGSDF